MTTVTRLSESQAYLTAAALRIAAERYEAYANEFRTQSAKADMAEAPRLELIRSFTDQHNQALALADLFENAAAVQVQQ